MREYPGADTELLAFFGGKFPAVFFFVEERERERESSLRKY